MSRTQDYLKFKHNVFSWMRIRKCMGHIIGVAFYRDISIGLGLYYAHIFQQLCKHVLLTYIYIQPQIPSSQYTFLLALCIYGIRTMSLHHWAEKWGLLLNYSIHIVWSCNYVCISFCYRMLDLAVRQWFPCAVRGIAAKWHWWGTPAHPDTESGVRHGILGISPGFLLCTGYLT